jgi:hypothetical protein
MGQLFLGLGEGSSVIYSVIEVQAQPFGSKQTLCWSPGQLPDFDQQGSSVTSGLPFCWEHRQKQPSWRPADGTSNRNSGQEPRLWLGDENVAAINRLCVRLTGRR